LQAESRKQAQHQPSDYCSAKTKIKLCQSLLAITYSPSQVVLKHQILHIRRVIPHKVAQNTFRRSHLPPKANFLLFLTRFLSVTQTISSNPRPIDRRPPVHSKIWQADPREANPRLDTQILQHSSVPLRFFIYSEQGVP
jgi:hypothetical protein